MCRMSEEPPDRPAGRQPEPSAESPPASEQPKPAEPAAEPAAQPAAQPTATTAPPAAPAAAPPRRWRTSSMRVWVAALIAVLVLIGAGLGGFFIGMASANDHDRAGGRAGVGRMHHGQMPGGPGWLQGPRGYYYGPVPGP